MREGEREERKGGEEGKRREMRSANQLIRGYSD